MKKAYRKGLLWIAENDEPTETLLFIVKDQLTVALLANVFDRDPQQVAEEIIAIRQESLCASKLGE